MRSFLYEKKKVVPLTWLYEDNDAKKFPLLYFSFSFSSQQDSLLSYPGLVVIRYNF